MASYKLVHSGGRVHYTDLTHSEVGKLCDELGYDRAHVLRKLRDRGRVVLKDDLGKFSIVRQQKRLNDVETEAEADRLPHRFE
jgi:hypothetical protein